MTIDKYAAISDRKQEVVGLDICSLTGRHGRCPIVVASEPDRIVLHWHANNPATSFPLGWRQHEILHRPYSPGADIPDARQLLDLPWSQRVGLATTPRHVFLVYKRRLGGVTALWLSVFDWIDDQEILIAHGDPVPLATEVLGLQQVGYSLWAGFDETSQRLVVLTQAFRSAGPLVLTMLRGSLEDVVREPGNPAVWLADDIAQRGYQLDATLRRGRLTFAYRHTMPDVRMSDARIRLDRQVHLIPFDDADDVDLNALISVRTIDVETLDILESDDRVPGGAHPQIQNLDPLYISCDRIDGGIAQVGPEPRQLLADPSGDGVAPPPTFVRFERLFGHKQLLRKVDGNWFSIDFVPLDFTIHPRHVLPYLARPRSLRRESGQIVMSVAESRLSAGQQRALLPTHAVNFSVDQDKGTEILDFLHHDIGRAALLHTRLELFVWEDGLERHSRTFRVVDINHERIREPSSDAVPMWENEQFRPFSTAEFIYPLTPGRPSPFRRDAYQLDNTLGGLLAVDPGQPSLQYYAYTDLGDAGVRVVSFGEPLADGPTAEWEEKGQLTPEVVSGPGNPSDVWVELAHLPGAWLAAELPGFRSPPMLPDESQPAFSWTLGSQVERILDTMFWFSAQETPTGTTDRFVVTPAFAELFDGFAPGDEAVWDLLWSPLAELPPNGFFAAYGGTLRIAKYRIAFRSDLSLPPDPALGPRPDLFEFVEVVNVGAYDSDIRFLGSANGQGRVEYRTKLDFDLDQMALAPLLRAVIALDHVRVSMYLRRSFTPAILMSDRRSRDSLSNALDPNPTETTRRPAETPGGGDRPTSMAPAALSARPVGPVSLDFGDVEISLSTRPLSWAVVSALAAALMTLGLFGLETLVAAVASGGVAIIAAGVALPAVLLAWLAAFLTLYFLSAWAIENALKGIIRATFAQQRDRIIAGMERFNPLRYAGEGIGEAIARKVLQHPDVGLPVDSEEPASDGRNRFRSQFWQSIFVGENSCRVLVRMSRR